MAPAALRIAVTPPGPYLPGDAVRLAVTIVDETSGIDVPVDPDLLTARVQAPGPEGAARLPAEVVWLWYSPANPDAPLSPPATDIIQPVDGDAAAIVGSLYLDLTLATSGTWRVRFVATGAAVAANEVAIEVERSAFPNP